MFVLFGTRHLNPRRVAVRNDYCNCCQQTSLTQLVETSDYGHLFFIPFLPLGRRKRWHCLRCGKDPRARYRTSKAARIMGLFLFPIFILLPFFPSKDHSHPEDAQAVWTFSAFFGLIWLYLLYSVIKGNKDPIADQKRAEVIPLGLHECVFCQGPLMLEPEPHCPSCGIVIYGRARQVPPPLPPRV